MGERVESSSENFRFAYKMTLFNHSSNSGTIIGVIPKMTHIKPSPLDFHLRVLTYGDVQDLKKYLLIQKNA